MKTAMYFFFASVFFSFSAFAQNDFDGQGILYSNSAGTAVAVGSAPQGNYGVSGATAERALEINSSAGTFFNLKSGTNSMWLVNHTIYGNYLSAPTNLPFDMRIGFGGAPALRLQTNGNVSIGTTVNASGFKLAVGGKIIAEELRIMLQSAPWPDYVFASDYKLPTLQEVEKQIQDKGHLANMPSADEVKANGIAVGEMNKLLLEKVEELTLYAIEQNKISEKQSKEIKTQTEVLEKQAKELEELKVLVKALVEKQ